MLTTELRYKPMGCIEATKQRLNLTDEESKIFDLAIRDKSITEMARVLCVSESTVNRRLKSVRMKIYEDRIYGGA